MNTAQPKMVTVRKMFLILRMASPIENFILSFLQ